MKWSSFRLPLTYKVYFDAPTQKPRYLQWRHSKQVILDRRTKPSSIPIIHTKTKTIATTHTETYLILTLELSQVRPPTPKSNKFRPPSQKIKSISMLTRKPSDLWPSYKHQHISTTHTKTKPIDAHTKTYFIPTLKLTTQKLVSSLRWNKVNFDRPHRNQINFDHPRKKTSQFPCSHENQVICGPHTTASPFRPPTQKPSQSIPTLKASHLRPGHKKHVNFDPHAANQVIFYPCFKIK